MKYTRAARRDGWITHPTRYAAWVRLAVGDVVVYRRHGVGRVAARERGVVHGGEEEIVVLECAGGLTVMMPIDRAREQLRPLASKTDVRRVQETLREDHALSSDSWLRRYKDTQAKLRGGDLIELAEIVRDGASRGRKLTANGGRSQLSPGERELVVKARQLLSGEIALARGLDAAKADAWIEDQVTPS